MQSLDQHNYKPKKEVCNYYTSWQVGALAWSESQNENPYQFAIGSLIEDIQNYIQIVELSPLHSAEKDDEIDDFSMVAEHPVDYPVTKIQWKPASSSYGNNAELLASTGDMLRIWTSKSTGIFNDDGCISKSLTQLCSLNTKLGSILPLTSMDWNRLDSRIIVTSSVDTTCTVWDIETQQPKTQLIAHDKEVYDVKFIPNTTDLFYTCGADGSVRMFDLRTLDHSTIIYEERPKILPNAHLNADGEYSPNGTASFISPLLRISTSLLDPNYLSVLALDSDKVSIIDLRVPGVTLAQLVGHKSPISACEWSPASRYQLATASTDSNVLVWDISAVAADKICGINPKTINQRVLQPNQTNNDILNDSSSFGVPQDYGNVPNSQFTFAGAGASTGAINYGRNDGNDGNGMPESFNSEPQLQNIYTPNPTDISPSLTYAAEMPINSLSWNMTNQDWIGIAFGYTVQALRL